jgi:hypothetical protein
MKLHKMAVEAIAVIRQYDYENGHPPFEVCWQHQLESCSKYYWRVGRATDRRLGVSNFW